MDIIVNKMNVNVQNIIKNENLYSTILYIIYWPYIAIDSNRQKFSLDISFGLLDILTERQ